MKQTNKKKTFIKVLLKILKDKYLELIDFIVRTFNSFKIIILHAHNIDWESCEESFETLIFILYSWDSHYQVTALIFWE